ncbi:hypothetical protein PRIPAC_81429 [Pristionchus pacificus]|uniref:Metalloendopeptidase n=1 Tax=Pristionchus pacificus TaxID=54126 RepID=A0A2A6CJY3_PRIPA|nr:hypothetical protein PRIPAC_81429 [Pristionchus pacificus]|eukprot:PDM78331.1 metallopeptidase [Pristionchus pacificus]
MADYQRKVIIILLLAVAAAAAAGESTTQGPKKSIIDEKSEKTAEDLEKVKQSLQHLNEKVIARSNTTAESPHLKILLGLDLGPESNETRVNEAEMNKGVKEYLMGGDISVNPSQAAALVAAHGATTHTPPPKDEIEEKKIVQHRKRAVSLFDVLHATTAPTVKHICAESPNESNNLELTTPASARRVKRGFQTDPKYAWDPTKPIPYFFDPSLAASSIAVIQQGIALWQNNTCLNFVENPSGDNALRFFSGAGCYASIGRQGTQTQDVSIGVGCDNLGTVMHETNHAIGFFHTMSRPDRDNFISINFANVDASEQYNFVQNAPGTDNSFNVTYDYSSVMEYDQYAWAANSSIPTIIALDKWMQTTMGQRTGAAWSDIKQANLAYSCPAKCPGKTCSNGGIANSRDCTKCLCPPGFGGASCDDVAVGDAAVCNGGTLTATAQPQTVLAAAGTNDYVAYPTATNCYWMINAPAGKKVTFQLTAAPVSCVQGCVWQGVEIYMGNFDAWGVTGLPPVSCADRQRASLIWASIVAVRVLSFIVAQEARIATHAVLGPENVLLDEVDQSVEEGTSSEMELEMRSEKRLLDRVRTNYKTMCFNRLSGELNSRINPPHPLDVDVETGVSFFKTAIFLVFAKML